MIVRFLLCVLVTAWQANHVITACLSREQFLASLDRSKTLFFEAELIQFAQHPTSGQEAFVRVKRILHQPPYNWQLSVGNVAHIRGIRPRPVDPMSCLPKLTARHSYLWVTSSSVSTGQSLEASLNFYPGGLFLLAGDDHPGMAGPLSPSTQPDVPQQDAAYAAHPQRNYLGQNPSQTVQALQRRSCDPGPCPIHLNPVCGPDGILYQNPCFLQQRACFQQTQFPSNGNAAAGQGRISQVEQSGRCRGSNIHDSVLCPSSNLCSYGARCSPNATMTPGSVQMLIPPACDCRHLQCSGERPSAVCSSDGQTYSNECYLKQAMCARQQVKRVRYYGTCASNPCLGHTCRWPGEHCEVDEMGQPKCVCPDPCPAVVVPVCGSDGMTYDSHCHLERTACLKMRDIWVLHAGQCSDESQCTILGLYCQGYEICAQVQARHQPYKGRVSTGSADSSTVATCLCPVCPEQGLGEKVCGTDGRTYRSECHLRAHACQYQLYEVKVRSRGPCDACSSTQCKYYAICQRNVDGEPQCICPTGCPYTEPGNTVCGTDGQTYENECHLRVRSCAEQRELFVMSKGPCKTCPNGCPLGYQCRNGECVCRDTCPESNVVEREVCGTDGRLYRNECELKRQACLQGTGVEIDPHGTRCSGNHGPKSEAEAKAWPQADQNHIPSCTCNAIGAQSEYCDQRGECHCKPGAGGPKCDHCVPGYWGMRNGHECMACSCHQHGALGLSCDQLTGQCECRPGVLGRQCSICPDPQGQLLGPSGCVPKPEEVVGHQIKPPTPSSITDDHRTSRMQTARTMTGRLFSAQTALLIQAPATLDPPVTVKIVLNSTGKDGMVLHYRVPPNEQQRMRNAQDHQFTLLLLDGHVECHYLDGHYPGGLYVARWPTPLTLNEPHTIQAGVAGRTNLPWVQVDTGSPVSGVQRSKLARWIEPDGFYVGGYGTMVIGRPMHVTDPIIKFGFTGCLLQLHIQTGYQPPVQHDVDLLSHDPKYLVWIGGGLSLSDRHEAPLCITVAQQRSSDRPKRRDLDRMQSYARPAEGDGCQQQPCQNGATCVPGVTKKGYECVCPPGWQGDLCETIVTVIPKFGGTSFIRLPGPGNEQAKQRKRFRLVLTGMITQVPGLLFFIPPTGPQHTGPFIAVYIDPNRYLVVQCRVGGGQRGIRSHSRMAQLRYLIPVELNQWHTIVVDKQWKTMSVRVNRQKTQRIQLVPNHFGRMSRKARLQFDLSKSPIYLGGYPFERDPIDFMDIRNGLYGAIQKVVINDAEAVLGGPISSNDLVDQHAPLSHTEYWYNTSQWQGPPCGPGHSPCRADLPKSVCRPNGDKAVCACATPLQMLKILTERAKNNVNLAEKLACDQRQQELRTNAMDQGKLDTKDMQYDDRTGVAPDFVYPKSNEARKLNNLSPFRKCGQPSIRFNGQTVLRLTNLIESTTNYNVRFNVQTTALHGLLLLALDRDNTTASRQDSRTSRSGPRSQEVTVIGMRNGRVELSIYLVNMDQPSGSAVASRTGRVVARLLHLESATLINDGQCHLVHALRSHHKISLLVDHMMTPGEFGSRTPLGSRASSVLYLGGAPIEIDGFPWEYRQNMTGCMGGMYVNERNMPTFRASQISPAGSLIDFCM